MGRSAPGERKRKRALPLRDRAHDFVDWMFLRLSWLPGIGGPVFSGVGAVSLALASFDDEQLESFPALIEWRPALFWVGIGASAVGIVFFVLVELARRQADDLKSQEGAELQLAMTDAIQPVLHRLTELVTRPSALYDTQLQKVIGSVLVAMPTLFRENQRLRMVIYKYEPARGARPKQLVVVDHVGRSKHRPRDFKSGDGGRGDAVFAWLEGREPRFVPDIQLEHDPRWKGSGRGYRTFVSAPICSDGAIYGMITVDAPTPGDLDETDVPMVTTLASLLAVAYGAKR